MVDPKTTARRCGCREQPQNSMWGPQVIIWMGMGMGMGEVRLERILRASWRQKLMQSDRELEPR